ncbi:MAG TPA: Gfo/Idh/MocA family oxidoreductase [Candidatus Nanopelagicaceae bacterium]|nr:Gfo/Idh/MocA family oxidoreductase [Candidatus Nanopelagicaceae bacterium]
MSGPRVGIIGYGLAGRVFHAPILKGVGFGIAGIVTHDSGRSAQAKSDHPAAEVLSSVDDLLNLKLDLVVVASVNKAHFENAVSAIDAGIPVVVDKPVGRNLDETVRLLDYAKSKNVPITAYYSRRWDSEALTTARVIRDASIGKVHRIESRFDRWRPEVRPNSWREQGSSDEGGGLLLDLQTHLVSQALFWAGPAEVAYASVRRIRGVTDDDVTIALRHSNGIESWLIVSAVSGFVGPRIRAFGNAGALVIDGLDPQEALLNAGKEPSDGYWTQAIETPARIVRGDEAEEITPEQGDYPGFYRRCAAALRGEGEWPVSTSEVQAVAKIIDDARNF